MTTSLNEVLVPSAVALGLTLALTPAMKRIAVHAGVVAMPAADRWHRTQIPLLGGVALVVATWAGVLVGRPMGMSVWALLGCATVLALVGLVDDIRAMRPQTKLILQILVASVMAAVGLQFEFTGIAAVDTLITLVWLVGITNAINLLDNMDGLAAGIAGIVVAFRLAFFVSDGYVEGMILSGVLLAVCLGFLVFNFNPASIFMGDVGSLFLGFMVAGVSLVGGWPYSRGTALVVVFPLLVLLVPIFDTTFVTIARVLAGRSIAQGGRDHTSHRLVALGVSERWAVVLLYGLAVLGGATAWLSYLYGFSYAAVLALILVVGIILFGVFLGRSQDYPEDAAVRGRVATFLAELSYKRQLATVALDTALIVAAYHTAYLLRFEAVAGPEHVLMRQSLPIVLVAQVSVFLLLRTHQGVWRHTGVSDLLRIARASALGTVFAVLGVLFVYRFDGYSRAVFVLYGIVLFLLVAASRISFRALDELFYNRINSGRPVIVYGAGKGGVMVLRELKDNTDLNWHVVAFIDDDRDKHGTRVQGIPVVGGLDRLEEILAAYAPKSIILSSSKVEEPRVAELRRRCGPFAASVLRASITFHGTDRPVTR